MKHIRKDLQLTQQDLALLLNVSRSTVAMFEKGMRHMPSEAMEKWLHFQTLWQQNQRKIHAPRPAPDTYLELQQQQSLASLNAHVQRASARMIALTQQLSRLEDRHRQLLQQLHLLKELMRESKPGSRHMELLKNREQMLMSRLAGCCPERRQLLAFRLQVLTSQQKAALAGKVVLQQLR